MSQALDALSAHAKFVIRALYFHYRNLFYFDWFSSVIRECLVRLISERKISAVNGKITSPTARLKWYIRPRIRSRDSVLLVMMKRSSSLLISIQWHFEFLERVQIRLWHDLQSLWCGYIPIAYNGVKRTDVGMHISDRSSTIVKQQYICYCKTFRTKMIR